MKRTSRQNEPPEARSQMVGHLSFIDTRWHRGEIPRLLDGRVLIILKCLGMLALIAGLTTVLHLSLLARWRPTYGSADVYVVSSSDMGGVFEIYLLEYLNASIGSLTLEPDVAFTKSSPTANRIDLNVSYVPSGQILKIKIDRILITNQSLSLNYPWKDERDRTYVYVHLPSNLNATVYGTSVVKATTPFGEIVIYGVSYAVEYSMGTRRFLDAPFWHDFYRIPDVFCLLLITLSALLVGVLTLGLKLAGERYPFATLLLIAMTVIVYLRLGTGYSLIYGRYKDIPSLWIVFALSPFFHGNYRHFSGNLSLLLPLGLALEWGLSWRSVRQRLGLFLLIAYTSSWVPALLLPYLYPVPPGGFGLSFAVIWLAVLYLFLFWRQRTTLPLSRKLLMWSLIVGYCLLNPTYGWVSEAVINPIEKANFGLAFTHLFSLLVACLVIPLILFIVAKFHVKKSGPSPFIQDRTNPKLIPSSPKVKRHPVQ